MLKQVIVVRKDLKMRRGKEIAQACHASMKVVLENSDHEDVESWLESSFTKIVVSVDSEDELLAIYTSAHNSGLICSLIKDSGRTEFNNVPTYTALAIGPAESKLIDVITKDLKLR